MKQKTNLLAKSNYEREYTYSTLVTACVQYRFIVFETKLNMSGFKCTVQASLALGVNSL